MDNDTKIIEFQLNCNMCKTIISSKLERVNVDYNGNPTTGSIKKVFHKNIFKDISCDVCEDDMLSFSAKTGLSDNDLPF